MKFRKNIIVGFGIVAVVIAILIGLIMVPLLSVIGKDSAQLGFQKGELIKLQADEKSLDEFRVHQKTYAANLAQLDALLVHPETPIAFIEFLEKIARESNFTLDMTPGNAKKFKGERWPSMTFHISSETPYPNFLSFFKKLENAPYLMELNNVSLSKIVSREENAATGIVDFSVFMKVYTSPIPKKQ